MFSKKVKTRDTPHLADEIIMSNCGGCSLPPSVRPIDIVNRKHKPRPAPGSARLKDALELQAAQVVLVCKSK